MTARDFARDLGHALRRDTPAFGGTADLYANARSLETAALAALLAGDKQAATDILDRLNRGEANTVALVAEELAEMAWARSQR